MLWTSKQLQSLFHFPTSIQSTVFLCLQCPPFWSSIFLFIYEHFLQLHTHICRCGVPRKIIIQPQKSGQECLWAQQSKDSLVDHAFHLIHPCTLPWACPIFRGIVSHHVWSLALTEALQVHPTKEHGVLISRTDLPFPLAVWSIAAPLLASNF